MKLHLLEQDFTGETGFHRKIPQAGFTFHRIQRADDFSGGTGITDPAVPCGQVMLFLQAPQTVDGGGNGGWE